MSLGIKPTTKDHRQVDVFNIKTEIAIAKFDQYRAKPRPIRIRKPRGKSPR